MTQLTAEAAYHLAFDEGRTASAEGPLNLAKGLARQHGLSRDEQLRLRDLILRQVGDGLLVREQQRGIAQMFTYRRLRAGEEPQPAPRRHQQGRQMVYRTAS